MFRSTDDATSRGPRGGFIALWVLCVVACRQDAPAPVEAPSTAATRFDELPSEPASRRATPQAVARAVARARGEWWSVATRSLTRATARTLVGAPSSDAPPGEVVGRVERAAGELSLRLHTGELLSTFRPQQVVDAQCDRSSWVPTWLPAATFGSGGALSAETEFVWWQFEQEEGPPILLRFGPRGVALWRPDPTGRCYVGESFLGAAAGGVAVDDYATPVAYIGDDPPTHSGDTDGDKPLYVDLLDARGDETLTARDGVVELRDARKRLQKRWSTTLGAGVACTAAAVHRFDGTQRHLFVELDFNDSETCDEDWTAREGVQEVFRVRGATLEPLLRSTTADVLDDAGRSSVRSSYDLAIPMGDGHLRFTGSGVSTQVEDGAPGDACEAWLRDTHHVEGALTSIDEAHTGDWQFRTPSSTRAVGKVRVHARSTQCNAAIEP